MTTHCNKHLDSSFDFSTFNMSRFVVLFQMFHSQVFGSVNKPWGIAFNKSGELFVASCYQVNLIDSSQLSQYCIKKINKNGELIHVAGKESTRGNMNGLETQFPYPSGIDIDEN